jgi:hypothetical protein
VLPHTQSRREQPRVSVTCYLLFIYVLDKTLRVITHPLDASDRKVVIYEGLWINDTWIVNIPFEAVGSLDVPIKFQYYKVTPMGGIIPRFIGRLQGYFT